MHRVEAAHVELMEQGEQAFRHVKCEFVLVILDEKSGGKPLHENLCKMLQFW